METTKSVSKSRVVLTWAAMVGIIILVSALSFWYVSGVGTRPSMETAAPPVNSVVHVILLWFVGVLFLVPGVVGYFLVIFTCCFTFNYGQPVWESVKTKKYLANIIVVVALGLGIGFIMSGFLSPLAVRMGLQGAQADVLPVLGVLVAIQLMQLWVLIWSPVERRLIARRLKAMGISRQQLQGATLVGISDPASGLVKRFGAIEEDMGALWVTPERLAFRGDMEQFDLTHDQIADIERKADNRSVTVLAGIAHVILHVRLPDSSIRQLRLHVEGLWTMGQKRRAMDALADAIERWYARHTAVSGQ